MTPEKILELKFYSRDLRREVTVRQFLCKLLKKLFEEEEGFSGKRPLGNSDWQDDLIICFIRNKIIDGVIYHHGLEDYDYSEYEFIIHKVIDCL